MRKQITLELDEESLRLLKSAIELHNVNHNQMLQRVRGRIARAQKAAKPVKEINLLYARAIDIPRVELSVHNYTPEQAQQEAQICDIR